MPSSLAPSSSSSSAILPCPRPQHANLREAADRLSGSLVAAAAQDIVDAVISGMRAAGPRQEPECEQAHAPGHAGSPGEVQLDTTGASHHQHQQSMGTEAAGQGSETDIAMDTGCGAESAQGAQGTGPLGATDQLAHSLQHQALGQGQATGAGAPGQDVPEVRHPPSVHEVWRVTDTELESGLKLLDQVQVSGE